MGTLRNGFQRRLADATFDHAVERAVGAVSALDGTPLLTEAHG